MRARVGVVGLILSLMPVWVWGCGATSTALPKPAAGSVARRATVARAPVTPTTTALASTAPGPGEGRPLADVMREILAADDQLELEVDGGAPAEAARAETFADWDIYQHEHRHQCVGSLDRLARPAHITFAGGNAALEGYKMRVQLTDATAERDLRVGVLGAPKDALAATQDNLLHFLEWFRAEGVRVVVVNGDIGYSGEDLTATFELLGTSGLLVIVHAGNADPVGEFNRAAREVGARHPTLVNGNLVRLIEVGPASLIILPGYHDGRYIASGAGCQYYGEDVADLARLVDEAAGTPVLVAHGPPRGSGSASIDQAWDAGAVGDEQLTAFMASRKVRFGIFGHILEAGGRAVDPQTGQALASGAWADAAWLNAGSSTSLSVDLQDGGEHHGMAGIVELDGARMRHRWDVRR